MWALTGEPVTAQNSGRLLPLRGAGALQQRDDFLGQGAQAAANRAHPISQSPGAHSFCATLDGMDFISGESNRLVLGHNVLGLLRFRMGYM